jgi:hypothetical protein
LAFGLNEMPSRIAILLIVSGFRPVAFSAWSNDFEARQLNQIPQFFQRPNCFSSHGWALQSGQSR